MMIGLGFAPVISPGDQCLSLRTFQPVPCTNDDDTLCWDSFTDTYERCANLPRGTPLPKYTLPELLNMAPNQGQQVISAGSCDPMAIATGFLCSNLGPVSFYTRGQKSYNADSGSLYDAPITPQTLALTPTQTISLINAGLINPITSMNQPIQPTFSPISNTPVSVAVTPPPNSVPIYMQQQPTAPYVPSPTPAPPSPTQPAATTPSASPTQPTVISQSSTPVPIMTQPIATAGGVLSDTATQSGGQILPGLNNKTLYILSGALVLLMVMKK